MFEQFSRAVSRVDVIWLLLSTRVRPATDKIWLRLFSTFVPEFFSRI